MQKLLNWIIVFLVILLLALIGYYFYNQQKGKKETKIIGTVVMDNKTVSSLPPIDTEFNFTTIDGMNYRLKASKKRILIESLEDKIVFLKIFGWDCKFCQKEIPQLIKLKKEFGDTFEVIAIESEQHSKEESEMYVKRYGINYHIVEGTKLIKFYDYIKVYYGWNGVIPLTIVLGHNGRILAFEEGKKSYTLAELVKASIAKNNR